MEKEFVYIQIMIPTLETGIMINFQDTVYIFFQTVKDILVNFLIAPKMEKESILMLMETLTTVVGNQTKNMDLVFMTTL